MAINFGAEYRRFNKEMEKKHRLYAQLEMTQEQIDALDAFDKEEFLSNNNYKRHVLSLDIDENTDAPEDQPLLYRKFGDALSVELKVTFREKCDWLEDITSPELKRKLLSLSPKDLAILDLYVFEEKTQQEVAKQYRPIGDDKRWANNDTSARQCSSPEGGISMLRVGMDTRYGLYDPGC